MTDRKDSATQLLVDASDTIDQRATQRDTPEGERSMRRTVATFNAMFGTHLTEAMGWQFMVLLKMSRAAGGRQRRDDFLDMAAYAALAGECALGGQLDPELARALRGGYDLDKGQPRP